MPPGGDLALTEPHVRLLQYDELPSDLRAAAIAHRYRFDAMRVEAPSAVHGTTRGAIRALQWVELAGKTVLDVGCGEGTLGIAAVVLGARRAIGLDIDGEIVDLARKNA